MKTVELAIIASTLAFVLAPVAEAQQGPASAPTSVAVAVAPGVATPVATTAKKPRDPNKLICRTEEVTGSRLGGARTCLTQKQWDEKDAADLDRMNSGQTRGGYLVPH